MAATDEMIKIASQISPPKIAVLLPEKREELTTEGGSRCSFSITTNEGSL